MQEKVREEFGVCFVSKNIKILKCFGALDPGNKNYLNYNSLEYLLNHFHFLDINCSLLKKNRSMAWSSCQPEKVWESVEAYLPVATSTASVERVFSGMNRTCKKLKSKLIPERLGDYITISINREIAVKLDLNKIIDKWSQVVARKVII